MCTLKAWRLRNVYVSDWQKELEMRVIIPLRNL